jgi:outer membrane immunogenic protein
MKKLLLGTVALAALAVPALAADMGVVRRPVAYVAATNWSGCYVGGDVGYASGHSQGYSTNAASTDGAHNGFAPLVAGQALSSDFNMTGVAGGFFGGCNYQVGAWVFGAEGDMTWMNMEGQAFNPNGPSATTVRGVGGAVFAVPPGAYISAKENWLVTARGRLGYAVDKWLLYATGGGAWMKINSAESVTPTGIIPGNTGGPAFTFDTQSDTRSGWTVGGGIEYMLPYNWIIRAEYLYVQIPSYTTFTPGVSPERAKNVTAGQLSDNIVRFGLAYKFDFYGTARVYR